ncbi:MAG: acetyl-CoA C-acyltransferase [Myxococcaceae bacterium]
MNAFIYDAVRTPRGAGKESGALAKVKPVELLKPLYGALRERTGVDDVEDIVLGCSVQTGEQGANLAKISALYAGFGPSASGVTLNRFCASGLDALAYAALKVSSGMERQVVAGGVESLSRVGMFADKGPWFADPEVASSTHFVHMGVAADLIAAIEGISREECDALALQSQQRAKVAREEGRFARSMIPVAGLERDECVREGVTAAKLATMPAAFAELGAEALPRIREAYPALKTLPAVHHAGSAPALADGASLLLVGSEKTKARARIRAYANVAVEPRAMLSGAAPAAQKALRLAGLDVKDLDLVEMNESFAAPVLSFMRQMGLASDKVNVNGGAIALGHPLGATGGVLAMTLLDELERGGKALGLVVIVAGAGIAQALILERFDSR